MSAARPIWELDINVAKTISFAVPEHPGQLLHRRASSSDNDEAPRPKKRRRKTMTEPRARAARHKGQLNFQSD
ncbi:MAG: hypothetical protein LQ347_007018, partial [Umbilicaria vellea]